MSGGGAVPAERLELLESVLGALEARGLPRAEVFAKRGRARVIEETPGGVTVSYHREEGWAARAGDDRSSLFGAATGAPRPEGPGGAWPEADGEALTLPDPVAPLAGAAGDPGGAWREPPDLAAPLVGEREAVGLLATLGEELASELPGTRILRARLSDGASEWEIASRLDGAPGVAGAARGRVALLRVEAVSNGGPAGGVAVRAALEVAAREATALEPRALARRLADRLSVAAKGSAPERDRAVALLAPAVGARLLAGLVPLFFGEAGDELAAGLEDRDGRFASDAVTVMEDGRLPGGLLAVPVDGEGLPTAAAALVRSGDRRPPLVAPVRAGSGVRRPGRGQPTGRAGRSWACMRRPSWRDLPAPGPSHLYFEPSGGLGVGEMLREVARGYYLIDVDGALRIDLAADRISIPVVGFRVERGAAASPLAGAVIEGGLGPFLRRIEAAARDLTFFPLAGGMVGAPTLRVEGAELVRR